MAKQLYNWGKVQSGDIISFRYKGKSDSALLTTLLVLNPRIRYTKKNGETNQHLVGLKLEQSGNVPTIRSKPVVAQILESIGEISVVNESDEIYRVDIKNAGRLGVPKQTYKTIKKKLKQFSVYRTYNYEEARKSPVFLEPIKLPQDLVRALNED